MKTKEIYNDFMVKADIEHGMFVALESNEACLASVSLFRDRFRTEFTHSDLQILQYLAPHLRRAFKLHFHFAELKAHSASIETALDMLPTGVILLGSNGEIVFMNRSAAAVVAEKDGLVATRSGLQAELTSESNLLTKTVLHASSTSNGNGLSAGGTVLVSRRSRPQLQILISPIRNPMLQSSQKIAAVAFINDPLRQQRPDQAVLRTLYGLTPAECRVALLLGDGQAPQQIANTVGVTENTVRSQIKSVFSKTGVKRQGELIRLLLSYSGPTIQGTRSV
jgi:DNA-binding CsgD family transcriptional regulator